MLSYFIIISKPLVRLIQNFKDQLINNCAISDKVSASYLNEHSQNCGPGIDRRFFGVIRYLLTRLNRIEYSSYTDSCQWNRYISDFAALELIDLV